MQSADVRRISGGEGVYRTVLGLLEHLMRTQLIPVERLESRKGGGSVACWGQKQRNKKPSIL
jgi:hypothetical protein